MWLIDGILERLRKAGSSGIKVALQIPLIFTEYSRFRTLKITT